MEIAKTMPLLDCDRVFNVEMKVTQATEHEFTSNQT